MRIATLASPENQETVFDYIRQTRFEQDVWKLFDLERSTYYKYKKNHPVFKEKVNKLLAAVKVVPISEDSELIQQGKERFRNWVLGGCSKKQRKTRTRKQAVPLYEEDGKTPQKDENGKRRYAFELLWLDEEEIEYDNGMNLKALELIFPKALFSEKSLNYFTSKIIQWFMGQTDIDDSLKTAFYPLLHRFYDEECQHLIRQGENIK